MEVTRTFDLLKNYARHYIKDDALAGKYEGNWIKYSTQEYINLAACFSYGLLELGFKKGDKIATISNNRPEWNIIDMGMSQAGIVHVPLYPTISLEEQGYILDHAEAKMLIVSDKQLFEKLQPVVEKNIYIKDFYTINKVEGSRNWTEIIDLGKNNIDKYKEDLGLIMESISPSDIVTIIYTSGTTGQPKGVMLSHSNLISNCISTAEKHSLGFNNRALSFLPINHIYERLLNYHYQYKGISIYYAENLASIVDNMQEVHPHIFSTVPRVLEVIYSKIIEKGKSLPFLKRIVFFQSVNLGFRFELNYVNGLWYHLRLKLADKLVFNKWRKALGGNIKYIVSGGAAIQPRLIRLFDAAGLSVLEGYGLTETSPVIAVSDPLKNEVKIGTVGPVLKGVTIKIEDDGEILCKGPNVMLGYYKDPEQTKQVIDEDGWFHTGDIGILIDNKYLKITDRKKEIFKLSNGKYVAPQPIENKLKESFFIDQAMVIGENEKFASALISPNFIYLHNWCFLHGINFRDNEELISNSKILERFQREVIELNKGLGTSEQIKRFRLVKEEWRSTTGELSPTLKLKRKFLYEKYKLIIEEIFSTQKE